MYRNAIKRFIDIVLSLIGIVLTSPILVTIMILLQFVNQGAGVFFPQERPGRFGKSFYLLKFKSMTEECDEDGNLLPDEMRLTKVGNFIRKTSIDELPQLINVLRGDMSLIGPRPLSLVYLSFYTQKQARRHEVRPGITGWAQVHGRNSLLLSKKFEYDVWYVDNISMLLDIKILLLTVKKVFIRENIGDGANIMEEVDDLHITEKLMKYGSDYNYITDYKAGKSFSQIIGNAQFYACGRHALLSLLAQNKWKRIWMPTYFCYEVNDAIAKAQIGIEIKYYHDLPGGDDISSISKIRFEEGDVLLRMNYFGLRSLRDNSSLTVPVIEDHSHDLIGPWALNSNADWCIASLRKSIPISEGGVLWSPKKLQLPNIPRETVENNLLAAKRLEAMKLKTDFLLGKNKNRGYFRSLFISTEKEFANLKISKISADSWDVLNKLDIVDWYSRKKVNWNFLSEMGVEHVKILKPERDECTVFSLILLFDSSSLRNRVRNILIKRQCVYPAILWSIPDEKSPDSVIFENSMLSIHCDARYDNDLEDLKQRIVTAIKLALKDD